MTKKKLILLKFYPPPPFTSIRMPIADWFGALLPFVGYVGFGLAVFSFSSHHYITRIWFYIFWSRGGVTLERLTLCGFGIGALRTTFGVLTVSPRENTILSMIVMRIRVPRK